MSARGRLLAYLQQAGLSTARAEANLDAFAHELAEQQRDMRPTAPPGFELRPEYVDAWRDGAKSAAEMIDPEVKS